MIFAVIDSLPSQLCRVTLSFSVSPSPLWGGPTQPKAERGGGRTILSGTDLTPRIVLHTGKTCATPTPNPPHKGEGVTRARLSVLFEHGGAHIFFDQFPDMIDIAHEFGRALHVERARAWQVDLDDLVDAAGPARENEDTI